MSRDKMGTMTVPTDKDVPRRKEETMWNITDIKTKGREAFKLNYWPCVIVSAIYMLLFGGNTSRVTTSVSPSNVSVDVSVHGQNIAEAAQNMTSEQQIAVAGFAFVGVLIALAVGLLVKAFIVNPVEVGASRFFKNNVDDSTTSVGVLAEGFSDFGRTFVTLLLRDLIIAAGCILLFIPGLYAIYCFRMVPYIVKDNPELAPMDVLKRSNQMMQGNKWQAFVLDLTFIGWYLLGAITFGLGLIFWTNPYHMSANAALYKELSNQI